MGTARRVGAQRYLPVGYLCTAIAISALLLPTALRPPQDLQSSTTAFSPDAPPDEAPPEAILQSLRQARSSTAGGSAPEQLIEEEKRLVEQEEEEELASAPPPPPPPKKRAVRSRCFGDPPRVTESVYSALCVPAFTGGDNGGATSRGVTKDEIKVGILVPLSASIGLDGPIEPEFKEDDTPARRALKVWQAYFNERYEFYGRSIRLYAVRASDQDEDQARGAIRDADDRYGGIFGWIGDGAALPTATMVAEAVRRKMIIFAIGQNPVDFYKDSHPFAYSFTQDSWQTRQIGGELICKQWVGKPLGENNMNNKQDLTFDYAGPRKWGLIIYQDEIRVGARKMYEDALAKCGEKFVEVAEYNLTDNQQAIAGTAAKMKRAGATSVIMALDPLTPGVVSNEAERLAYYPEWIGTTGTDSAAAGRLMQDNQAEHLVALRSSEIPRPHEDKDWFRAYKEVAPDEEPPDGQYGPGVYRALQQIAGGVQLAGANLTPQTFWQGLKQTPCRTPEPVWSIGGCYKDPDPASDLHFLGDYTYADYVSLGWFDNKADDPESVSTGAFCWMHGGKRYKYKEMPTDPLPFRIPTGCIVTPVRGEQG